MIQVRRGVFETNSSSTHSICIAKGEIGTLPKAIHFGFGEYGWANDTVYDTADYLYTAIYECGMETYIDEIKRTLDKHNVAYTFKTPKHSQYGFDSGYIDHGYELTDFIITVCADEDRLLRYLFGSSVIYTGNDNSSEDSDLCNSADEFIWDDDNKVPNPNHDNAKYEYFYKGN